MHWALDLPERGRTYTRRGVIVLRHGMSTPRTVSTLAHEIGHLYYGDLPPYPGWVEARAWRWAARLLIPSQDLAEAEQEHHSPGALAQHLGVTTDVIEALQEAA